MQRVNAIPIRAYARLLRDYLQPQIPRALLLAVLLLSSIGLQLATPQIVRYFLDSAEAQTGIERLFNAAALFMAVAIVRQIVFIAATYTPLALVLLPSGEAVRLLTLIWTVAVVGLSVRVFWHTAPRWLDVACYLLMGWAGLAWLPAFWTNGSPVIVGLIGLGGLFYTIGAVIYGRKRPDPSPAWFGFHEVFHACTIAAALCHFAAITLAVLG